MDDAWHEKKLLYFAWIRERVGVEEEIVVVPQTVETVRDLLEWLKTRGEEFASAFEFPDIIRVASDNVPLGEGLGVLQFLPDSPRGLSANLFERDVRVSFRQGGEEFQPEGQSHTRKLKKLLQQEGVVPC